MRPVHQAENAEIIVNPASGTPDLSVEEFSNGDEIASKTGQSDP